MIDDLQVQSSRRGVAAWVALDRAAKRNALSPTMIDQLGEALDVAEGDDSVRAVVLTGSGDVFCAGADLESGMLSAAGQDASAAAPDEAPRHPFARLLLRLQRSPKPVIVAVNGLAFGGGLGLIAAADIAIAVDDATFSFSEVRLGLMPAMISVVVVPKIGSHHARRLFVTGRRFTANEALDYGLIHRLVERADLESAVDQEVALIAKGGPIAVAEAKRLAIEMVVPPADAFDRAADSLAERLRSSEGREGIAAFVEGRSPRWRS